MVAVPLSWQVVGYFIFGSVAAGLLFISFASYPRVETVTGVIAPAAGVSVVLPTRPGVIASLSVREGEEVSKGSPLVTIRAEEDSASPLTAAAQVQLEIAKQSASLVAQSNAASSAAQAQLGQLAAEHRGLVAEIEQLQSQLGLQQELVASARRDYDRAKTVADRGFISARELEARHETLLSREQGMSQLNQSLANKRAALAEAERNAAQVAAQSRAQDAGLAAARAQVAQQAASTAGARAYVLRAPVAGRVTALTARPGQPVTPQAALMTIVPAGSPLRAELAAPSSAIGFIKPGQSVRIAVDAFPYQRFGTVEGRVLTVAMSPVSASGANGATVPAYPIFVALVRPSVTAFGHQEPLMSGMTLSARIVTERQSFLEWLFEPLFAVRRR